MKDGRPALSFARKFRRPFQVGWALSVLLLLAIPAAPQLKFLASLEDAALGLRFAIRGVLQPEPDEPPIVLVGIDDRSLEANFDPRDLAEEPWLLEFQNAWPWARSLHGELLRRLLEDGARTVAFDFLFPAEGTGDDGLQKELSKAGSRAVLAMDLVPEETATTGFFYRERLPSASVLPPDGATLLGFANIFPDDDGVVRKIVLATDIAWENRLFAPDPLQRDQLAALSDRLPDLPALSLAAARSFSRDFQPPFDPETGKGYRINYAGPSGWFASLSATEFFLPGRRQRAASLVDGAAVIIAPWSDFFKDDRPTPFGTMFGAEIHAHALRNLFLGDFLHAPGAAGRAIWLAVLSLLSALAVSVPRNVVPKAGLLAGVLIAWLLASQLAFTLGNLVLPAASGILLLLATGGGLLLYQYLLEQLERRQIKGYLSNYVSPSVTRILLESGEGFERLRKGEVRDVSILFSDIRGFTAASENRKPGDLTAQLNEYFRAMVDPVFAKDGSLNKYIGDAVFAVWGDLYPRGAETDARNALAAALLMREALAELNRDWEKRPERVPFRIGIGLHHGEAFVGNLGHPSRLEVAVMGESVNISSRIESANKHFGTDILVSEDLLRAAGHPSGLIAVDRVLLAGSSKPMDLYWPIAGRSAEASGEPPWVARWNRAVDDYRHRRFEQALDSFESLEEAPARVRQLYLGRCRDFLHTAPPEDWIPVQRLEK